MCVCVCVRTFLRALSQLTVGMLALECRTEVRGFRHGAATFCRAVLAGDKPKRKKEKGVRRDEKDRRERE